MKLLKITAAKLEKFLDRILCVLGAIIFSQAPEFIQQYLQKLGGVILGKQQALQKFYEDAATANISPEQLDIIARHSDKTVATIGENIHNFFTAHPANLLDQINQLIKAKTALQNSSLWERPFIFLRDLNTTIARETYTDYKPAVPVTLEGFIYAAIGIIIALIIYHGLIKWPISAILRRHRAKKENTPTEPPPSADKLPS